MLKGKKTGIILMLTIVTVMFLTACGGGGSGGSDSGTFILHSSISQPTTTRDAGGLLATIQGTDTQWVTGSQCDGDNSTCCDPGSNCSPTSVTGKFYKAWLSLNEDCSSPVLVADHGSNPPSVDIAGNIQLFTGTPPAGTYHCLIIKVSDTGSFKPNQASENLFPGVCTAGQTYWTDNFRSGQEQYWDMESNTQVDGQGTKTNPVEQVVYYFATTNRSAAIAYVGHQAQVGVLLSPVQITGGAVTNAYFVMDLTDKVDDYYDVHDSGLHLCYLAPTAVEVIVQ